MVAPLLTGQEETRALAELLRPERLPNGAEPEERLIICGVSWGRYLALDKALGDNRPCPRFYYLEGNLEIMTTSNEHERIKKWLADLMAVYFEETGIEIIPRGQATMRQALKNAGAEPDESWCLGQETEFPRLVLEVALTSGGVSKLEIYHRFPVPEVWFWRDNKLEIFVMRDDGAGYDQAPSSRCLPGLDTGLLERCVGIRSWQESRRAFRAGLRAGTAPA